MNSIGKPCCGRRLKVVLAGAFLVSCLWTAWRVAGAIVVVQGESMLPNFHPNDCAIAKPRPRQLERGEVVVLDDGKRDNALKRVVGLPGETIHLWHGQVFINRRLVHEPYLDRDTCTYPNQKLAVFILGQGQYFVMGDNRAVSLDSRTYGPVGIEQIRKTISQSAPKMIFLPCALPAPGQLTRRPAGGRGAARKFTAGRPRNACAGPTNLETQEISFLSFAHHVASQMPLAVMVENVPGFFGDSTIAGRVLMAHLERLGYHVHYFQVNPWDEWAEPQDRKRGVMVATLFSRFYPTIPATPFLGTAGDYLDAPDPERDREEAELIKNHIAGRDRHMTRHRAAGNRFGFSVITHQSRRVPTILRSYWKVNIGPFVECEGGVRLLRIPEIERLMGFVPKKEFTSRSYSTAVEILGQGVQTRVFRQLVSQLGDFLEHMLKTGKVPAPPQHRLLVDSQTRGPNRTVARPGTGSVLEARPGTK